MYLSVRFGVNSLLGGKNTSKVGLEFKFHTLIWSSYYEKVPFFFFFRYFIQVYVLDKVKYCNANQLNWAEAELPFQPV